MPKNDHYVIIGNGPAGNHAADVLRKNDPKARITIISDEGFPFYYRHKLCDFIAGKTNEQSLKARNYQEYKDKNIRMRLGQRVEKIDPENRVLYLKHMEKVGYSKLILSTGATHRIIPAVAGFEKYVSFMICYQDALLLKQEIKKIKNAVVLGGDLISLKFTKMLAKIGIQVTLFLYRECFWPFDMTKDMSEQVADSIKGPQITPLTDDYIVSVSGDENPYTVMTQSGQNLKTDRLFSFMGMMPNIDFIVGSGIDTEKGVLVDEFLRTNYKDVYACGDCAQIYNPDYNDYWISIGWENARIQGETAAYNLLGDHRVIKPAKSNILKVEGLNVNTSWWKEI